MKITTKTIKYYLGGGGWKLLILIVLISPILLVISPALIFSWLKDNHKKIAEIVEIICLIYFIIFVFSILAINLHYIMATVFKYSYYSLIALVILGVYILEKTSNKSK